MSKSMVRFIESSTNSRLSSNILTDQEKRTGAHDIWYVDDPDSAYEIQEYLENHAAGRCKSLVIAFDPLQLGDSMDDKSYRQLIRKFGVTGYHLETCYRQKENLGLNTSHVVKMIAASTPFLANKKVADYREARIMVTKLSNDMVFTNPAGYVKSYPDAQVSDIRFEVDRICRDEWLMWRHAPGLLVVEGLQNQFQLSDASNEALGPLETKGYVRRITLPQIGTIKGLEFQHVFIFLDKDQYEEINNGFRGTGQRIYDERRLLRIPFSRGRDSLVTFAL